jgi:hypothetical protein
MTSEVQLDDLADLPHRDGQTVLDAKRGNFEVKIERRHRIAVVRGGYKVQWSTSRTTQKRRGCNSRRE